ncbi:MAG: o-succinylbenzoate synthase [Acidimicrobiales bacterium]
MALAGVELRRLRLPMVAPVVTRFGTQSARDVLLVRAVAGTAEGWGECVAPAEPRYSSEFLAGAHLVVRDHLVPRLLAAGPVTAAGVAPVLAPVKGHPMAKAAVEMAVLDAELRVAGRSLAEWFGATATAVEACAMVGMAPSLPALVEEVGQRVEEGYRRVKLKIGPGWDLEAVAAVRDRFGAGLTVVVDANGAYTVADAAHLAQLDRFGLGFIEQPLAEGDLAGHARLAGLLRTPICLDESATSVAAVKRAVAMGAASAVSVKAARLGGYLAARRLHDQCAAAGVALWCGGMYETGLGRAANLALAALPGFTLGGDLAASARYFDPDVTPALVLEGARIRVPDGPGLGRSPLAGVLGEATQSVEWVPA